MGLHCLLAVALLTTSALAQDTRGAIAGTVTDQQSAAIASAAVILTNTETNAVFRTQTNAAGYYESNLLNPGRYSIAVEAPGFRRAVRTGVVLNVAGRIEIPLMLEIGQVTESIEVTAETPLLDTLTASGGRVIDQRQVMELPMSDLNPFALAVLAPGMQWTGLPQNRRLFDVGGTSDFNTMGGIGQNEYSIDGGTANGRNRSVGFVPPADSISEFKLETINFDASYGNTTGATINVQTKSGTNRFHGNLYEQHWQQRWNATPHFTRLAFEDAVRRGTRKAGDQRQESGRSNNFGASIGGPVLLPKLYSGKDKLFFFLNYNGIYERKTNATANVVNRTVPKMAWRQGDFSDLLRVDATRFTIYDPRSARREGSQVLRTPFPGNRGIPVLNPMFSFYESIYPTPNDVPGLVSPEGFNNYLASGLVDDSRFNSVINRIDYSINDRQRVFGRWYWNRRVPITRDWAYSTRPGIVSQGSYRVNKGAGGSYSWALNQTTLLDAGVFLTRFGQGEGVANRTVVQLKPTDAGLPAYLDQKAGDRSLLPRIDLNTIEDVSIAYPSITDIPTFAEAKVGLGTLVGNHSLKFGYSERRTWYTSASLGYTSGQFVFDNFYTRAADNTQTASNHALDWAAFMMGVPTQMNLDSNDTGFWSTRYRGLYVQDDYRVNSRLRFNIGLRYEREAGITERFNRGISGAFLPDAAIPYGSAAQNAYARSPIPELRTLPLAGGTAFLGESGRTFTNGTHRLLPRAAAVYQVTAKTVLRAGYGTFADTFNVANTRPSQLGYSVTTSTPVSNDLGLNFCCGAGAAGGLSASSNILKDPFPVRADGSRFDSALGRALGVSALAGRNIASFARNYSPAIQHRWRLSLQRELMRNLVLDASYNGSFARIPVDQPVNFLPAQYWASGTVRNQALDDDMNRNIANPYRIANLTALATSDPALYRYLSTQSFFTAANIRKNRLLRPYPHLGNVDGTRSGSEFASTRGSNIYHDLQVLLERRFSQGLQSSVMFTRASNFETDFYFNEFDAAPTQRPSDQVRPNRFVWSAIAEVPFGKGRRWMTRHPMQHLAGGWQFSWVYQYQSGPATNWSNRFFYGDLNTIGQLFRSADVHAQDIHVWFDPSIAFRGAGAVPSTFQGFEGRAANQPGAFHARVFPTRLDTLRADPLRMWDVKILRRFVIREGWNTTFSVDLLNATNHTVFEAPVTDPTNSNFGRVTGQFGLSRRIQLNWRMDF
ncbi:MAG: carboxypeptidase regulatory-like domain-containing protein [Bryobacterales bacterium]|nr:carboxypeptidase regulatory-like domain-containing protein [Bryobacterales bacterium]